MSKSEYARKLAAYHAELRRRYPHWTDDLIEDCVILPDHADARFRKMIDFKGDND